MVGQFKVQGNWAESRTSGLDLEDCAKIRIVPDIKKTIQNINIITRGRIVIENGNVLVSLFEK